MNNRKIWFYISLLVMSITIFLLVTGSSVLTMALDKENTIPLGTFITWIGIISLPMSIFLGIKGLRRPTSSFINMLSNLLKLMLILAFLWLPICYFLAGNISFSFSEKETFQGGQTAMKWFWYFSYGVAIGPILILIIYWFSKFFRK